MSSKYTVNDIITRNTLTRGSIIDHLDSEQLTKMQSEGDCTKIKPEDKFIVIDAFRSHSGGLIAKIKPLTGVEFRNSYYNQIDIDVKGTKLKYKNVKDKDCSVYEKSCRTYLQSFGSANIAFLCVQLNKKQTTNVLEGQSGILMYDSIVNSWCFKCYKKSASGLVLFSKVIHASDTTGEEKDTFTEITDPKEVAALTKKYKTDIKNIFSDVTIGSQAGMMTAYETYENAIVSNTDNTSYINIFNEQPEDDSLLPFEAEPDILKRIELSTVTKGFKSYYIVIKYSKENKTWQEVLSPYIPILSNYQLVYDKDRDMTGMAFSITDQYGEEYYHGYIAWQNNNNPFIERYKFLIENKTKYLQAKDEFFSREQEFDYNIVRQYLGLVPGMQIQINSDTIFVENSNMELGTKAYIVENCAEDDGKIDASSIYIIYRHKNLGYYQTVIETPTSGTSLTLIKQTNIKNKTVFTKLVDFEDDRNRDYNSNSLFVYPDAYSVARKFKEDTNLFGTQGQYDPSKIKIPQILNDSTALVSDADCKVYAEEVYLNLFMEINSLDDYIKSFLAKKDSFKNSAKLVVQGACPVIRISINRQILRKVNIGDKIEILEVNNNRAPVEKGDICLVKGINEIPNGGTEFYVLIERTGEEEYIQPDSKSGQIQLRVIK